MYLEVITESKLQVVDHNRSGVRSNSETTFLIYNLNRLIILYVCFVCMYAGICVYVMFMYLELMDGYDNNFHQVYTKN